MSVDPAAHPELQKQLYLGFSGLAILVFDYCINVNAEIIWIWDTKWTLVRILFLLARYVPFILVPVSIYYSSWIYPSRQTDCSRWNEAITGMIIISLAAAEVLLFIRTWVLWRKKRVVLIGLTALGSACLGVSTTLGALADVPTESHYTCIEPLRTMALLSNFYGLALFEFVILILTIIQIFKHDRRSRIFMIIRNDIVYTMCILGMSIMNSILLNQSPVLILQVVIHSVFGSRLLFSLRQIMRQQHIMSISAAQSTFRDADEMPTMVFSEDPGFSSRAVGVEYEC
ncbi:hypothetical protein BJ138DRAFT_1166823 [Hygrophoropsis aurantiaca]|uniref:Uncharacterized protein n=1 Tax=Hygrophoropsis aurantiaca TaxID=72124 RepID=A0ACB7ZT82_9AGAM|nr:hypothetical protein BJ138DRAFT_1166823 [Hygrophoropsis aurantiaca]